MNLPFRRALIFWFCGIPLASQMLIVDRGIPPSPDAAVRLGRAKGAGFVGDHFRAGQPGEVWIIDTLRVWSRPVDSAVRLGDLFEKVILFGGIEAVPPTPGQPPQPECDCHNLMAIKTAGLHPGSERPDGADASITPAAAGLRQIDFRNLSWSVPGGVNLQFGVMGVARGGRRAWYNQAAAMPEVHPLKLFDGKGKLEGPYATAEGRIGLNIRVWGHKSAPVTILSADAAAIEVALRGNASFDAAKADPATLRLGPKSAAPIAARLETVDGQPALIGRFRRTDTGLETSHINACLTGRQFDGVPFEGCDLLHWSK